MNHRDLLARFLTVAAAALALGAAAPAQISAYHNVSGATHQSNFSNLASNGYRMRSLSVHGTAANPRYTAVWQRESGPAFVAFHDRTPSQAATFISTWIGNGYRVQLFTSTGAGSNIVQAGVMVRDNVDARLTRGLTANGLGNRMSWAQDNGFIPSCVSAYGSASTPRFAVVLVPNPDKIPWNYGIDTQAEFVDRLDALGPTKVRPTFVDHNGHGDLVSIWRDDRVNGGYFVRVGMDGSGYQSSFTQYRNNGYYPLMTMGGGSGSGTRYAAIWVRNKNPIPWTFRKSGRSVSAMNGIDNWMETFIRTNRIRGGQIAIARRGHLIHARGYTFAEPDYDTVQPTSLFRIASLHKPLTGILTMRAVQDGRLSLDTLVWGNMGFTTFQDSRTRDVTVDHCLTHSGGWDRNTTFDPMFYDLQVAQGLNINLPIDVDDIWRFMSSQQSLQFSPGSQSVYSNYGYALIGEVLENRYSRSFTSLIDDRIFSVLGLTRPRLGRSILAFRAPGEVPYHPTIPDVRTTRLSASGVWVSRQYGGFHLENMKAHGGYIMAAPDYVKIIQALQYGGDRSILDDSHRTMLWSGRYPTATSNTLRGFFKTRLNTATGTANAYTHNGSLRGTATLMFHRADGITVAVFLNSDHDGFGTTEMGQINALLNTVTTWPDLDQFPDVGIPAFGSSTEFGQGCLGSNGRRVIHTGTDPYLGETCHLRLTNVLPNRLAIAILGISDAQWGSISLPLDLAPLGASGCSVFTDPTITTHTFTDNNGDAAVPLAIPDVTSLIGTAFFSQFLVTDPAANTLGIVTSNAVRYRVGGD